MAVDCFQQLHMHIHMTYSCSHSHGHVRFICILVLHFHIHIQTAMYIMKSQIQYGAPARSCHCQPLTSRSWTVLCLGCGAKLMGLPAACVVCKPPCQLLAGSWQPGPVACNVKSCWIPGKFWGWDLDACVCFAMLCCARNWNLRRVTICI